MLKLNALHHIAIISSNYERSKFFYTQILGFSVVREIYRKDKQSFKLDLSLNGNYVVELFSFPNPPLRITMPEATGLRHLAFEVSDLNEAIVILKNKNIFVEPVRVDENTSKQFTFIFDPDNLPIELYEK